MLLVIFASLPSLPRAAKKSEASMNRSKLPIEYLLTSSQAGLEGFELGRLDKIAHLRKQLRSLVDQWVQAEIEAELARWLLDCQRAQESSARALSPEIPFPLPGAGIAAAFLPLAGTALPSAPPSRTSSASRKQLAAISAGAGSALAPRSARRRPQQQERAQTQQREREHPPEHPRTLRRGIPSRRAPRAAGYASAARRRSSSGADC